MIFLLFFILISIAFFQYQYSRLKLLSPTFWAAIMFSLVSFVYCVTFFSMNSDISISTFFIILTFILVTGLGEYIGERIRIKKKADSFYHIVNDYGQGFIFISKWKVFFITIVYLYVAIDRYKHLAAIASTYGGGINGIISMMSSARVAFTAQNKRLVLGSTFVNQLGYIGEISTYICMYIFLHNRLINKRRDTYYLFPLIPDLIMRLVTTSRTSFIMLFFALGICYFSILLERGTLRRIRVPKWAYIAVFILSIVFLVYGRARNEANEIQLVSYIQMYTSASIYGLNLILNGNITKGPYFGFYSMQEIYRMLGITHDEELTFQRNFIFNRYGEASNLYTSLNVPILDFGIIGCIILRFLAAIVATKIIMGFLETNKQNRKKHLYLFFVISLLYCYFYSAFGDVFRDYYFNPGLMIRYLIYGIILLYGFLRPKIRI